MFKFDYETLFLFTIVNTAFCIPWYLAIFKSFRTGNQSYKSILFYGLVAFFSINLVFSDFYLFSGCILKDGKPINTLIDAIYFSIITFATIGYGDFAPNCNFAKVLVVTQSTIAIIFTPTFTGFLLISLLKRPENIVYPDKINVFLDGDDKIKLRFYLKNKGSSLIDVKIFFELIGKDLENKIDIPIWSLKREKDIFNSFWNILITPSTTNWDDYTIVNENDDAKVFIGRLIAFYNSNNPEFYFKFTIIGLDIKSGDIVSKIKYYTREHFTFEGQNEQRHSEINKIFTGLSNSD